MKVEQISDIITVSEYFNILSKEEELNPKDASQKNIFENFIRECELYPEHSTEAMQSIYSEYQKRLNELASKENRTKLENEVLGEYQQKIEQSNIVNENDDYQRRLVNNNKAGYIDATVILVMILNIGFIIAMALLGSK